MKVLILGSTGMLGSVVYDYLKKNSVLNVAATTRIKSEDKYVFDALEFLLDSTKGKFIKNFDYVINCIGIIKPYCKDDDPKGIKNAIQVNSLFPYKLSEFLKDSSTKIIQIATDCVYSGKKGSYTEDSLHDALDVYGKSKSLGEVKNNNLLNIRCSIIGPEIKVHSSLLDWFLSQPNGSELKGFSHHRWNGVTTLQFAQLCEFIIEENLFEEIVKINHVHHYLPNTTVDKYELLKIFADVFEKDFQIKNVSDVGKPVDRTIASNYRILSPQNEIKMKTAILELKKYMDNK